MSQYAQPSEDWRSGQPSLVGRDRERQLLHESLVAARAGGGVVVLIGGEAGIGKTTLVDDLRREAVADGARVLTGHCYDLTMTPPYGPWRDAFREFSARPGEPALPATLSPGSDEPEPESQTEFFEQMYDLLVSMTASQPVVVVLEDLHWSDPASIDLLRFLARRLEGHRLLFVVTYRDIELTRHHPFFQALPLLVREARAERVDLRRLAADDVRALVAGRYQLPEADESRLVAHLQAQAEGNPLFVGEVLRTLEEEAFLTRTPSGWQLRVLERVPVPPLVVQVIEGRLERLAEHERRLLQIAAVIGHVVPVDLWQSVADVDEERLFALIERGIEAHLLEPSGDAASVRFVHALVREALYGGALPTRRRIWHRQVAERLLEQPSQDPDTVARHLQQAGDTRAADWLVRAGERAQRAYALATAAERFEEALQLLERDDTRGGERGWLLYRIGRLLRYTDTERGIAFLEEAGAAAASVNDPVLAAYALADRGGQRCMINDLVRGLADMQAGVAALDDVARAEPERMSGQIAAWVADALPAEHGQRPATEPGAAPAGVTTRRGTLILWLAWAGRYAEALAIGEPYVALTAPVMTVRDGHADALHGLAIAYAATGRPDEARQAFEEARDAYRSINHRVMVAVTLADEWLDVSLRYRADRVEEHRGLIADARQIWRQASGATHANDWPRLRTLASSLLDGSWQEAREIALAVRDQRDVNTYWLIGPALGRLAREQGDRDLAWDLVRERLPRGPASDPGEHLFLSDIAQQQLAIDLALDAGDLPLAREWLEARDRWLAWSGSVCGLSEARLLWARHEHVSGDKAAARQHAAQALAHATEPRQPLALLAAHRFLGQLATEAGEHADAKESLTAALALADACAAPFERALTLLALAGLRHAAGQFDEARILAGEVRSICVPLGAAPTLARVDALESTLDTASAVTRYPAGLSAREVEVLRLVAQGLTDAEVAEQLFLARRTINTHLTSIYTKLGVSSRAAATRFAVENGLT